jgi:hypothetical protein
MAAQHAEQGLDQRAGVDLCTSVSAGASLEGKNW